MSESDSTHESWTSAQEDPEPEPHPLFEAISRGDLDAVKRLIAGLPVDCDDLITDTGHDGHTPLERAAYMAMFVRTRCFQPVPDEIVPLIVDYSFHVGFY